MLPDNMVGGGGAKIDVTITDDVERIHEIFLMPDMRSHIQAAQFPDTGEVVLAGGMVYDALRNSVRVASIIRIDIDGSVSQTGTLSTVRSQHATAALGDDSVVAVAGLGSGTSPITTVERIFSDGTTTAFTALTTARRAMQGATMGDKSAVVAGGYNSSSASLNTVERLFPDGTKTALPTLTTASSDPPLAKFGDGSVGVLTSSTRIDRYHTNGTKTAITLPSTSRSWRSLASLGDGSIVVLGNSSAVADTVFAIKVGIDGAVGAEFIVMTGNKSTEMGIDGWVGEMLSDGSAVFALGKESVAGAIRLGVVKILPNNTVVRLPDISCGRSPASQRVFYSPMKDGSVIFGNGDETLVADRYYPTQSSKKRVLIPACNRYRFTEHVSVQPAFVKDTEVLLDAPNTGIFYPEKGSIMK